MKGVINLSNEQGMADGWEARLLICGKNFWQCHKRRHPILWPLGVGMVAMGLFATLGYAALPEPEEIEDKPVAVNYIEQQGTHYGHPSGVSLAQVYPFAEAERGETAKEESKAKGSSQSAPAARNISLPAIPQRQPRPTNLPAIPARQAPIAANPVSQSVAPAKETRQENTYQSKIAFIGGEGVKVEQGKGE